MKNKISTLAFIALFSLAAVSANASPVEVYVGGTKYFIDITSKTSFDSIATTGANLQSQPWWGDSVTALAFKDAVGNNFPDVNDGWTGPLFAFERDVNIIVTKTLYSGLGEERLSAFNNYYWAYSVAAPTIAPVPEADTSAMLLTGLSVVGFMARRRKNTKA